MKDIIEQILDEGNSDNILIPGKHGETFIFEQVALIHLEEASFSVLHPLMKDVLPDDVMVFRIDYDQDNVSLVLEEDEDTIQDVFDEYYRLFNKDKNKVI